jgi:hypothetical protein
MTDDASPPRGDYGHYAPVYDADFRDRVRVDYEAPVLTLRDISLKHGIAGSTIQQWMRAGGWNMRQPHRVDPHDLVGRMLALLDGQIADLETVMKNGATEVAMLSKLVTTLDKVLLLKERIVRDKPRSSKRVEELRAKIAERIGELNRA